MIKLKEVITKEKDNELVNKLIELNEYNYYYLCPITNEEFEVLYNHYCKNVLYEEASKESRILKDLRLDEAYDLDDDGFNHIRDIPTEIIDTNEYEKYFDEDKGYEVIRKRRI